MSSIITDIKTKLNSTWQTMPSAADIRWAGQRTIALIDNQFFGFAQNSETFANGQKKAWRAYQEQQYQELVYGTSRAVKGGIGLYGATIDIAARASQTVAASPALKACGSILGIFSHIISWCEGIVAEIRLTWMIQATDAEIQELSEAQLERRLGEEFPLEDIQKFKQTGSQDILLRIRQQVKKNIFYRSFQIAIASLAITAFYTGAPIYAFGAASLAKARFAYNLYSKRAEHLNTALSVWEKTPRPLKASLRQYSSTHLKKLSSKSIGSLSFLTHLKPRITRENGAIGRKWRTVLCALSPTRCSWPKSRVYF